MPTLFELSSAIADLEQRLDAVEGDADAQAQAVTDYLNTLATRDEKLDSYAALIRELEARAHARKAEADRIAHRARRDEGKALLLKQRLVCFFQEHGLSTVETLRFRLTLGQNGGKPPVRLLVAAQDLPRQYVRQEVVSRPDLEAIRAALEAGEEVPGAVLGERGFSMRIG